VFSDFHFKTVFQGFIKIDGNFRSRRNSFRAYFRWMHIQFISCFRSTERFKFRNRFLNDFPRLYSEHPGKRQSMNPIAGEGRMTLLPVISHAHPADHYSPSGIILHSLWRIEIKPSVEFGKCTMFKTHFSSIKTAGEISCLIQILIKIPCCRKPLRTDNQYICSIQPEQIRTLPHIPELTKAINITSCDRPEKFPL